MLISFDTGCCDTLTQACRGSSLSARRGPCCLFGKNRTDGEEVQLHLFPTSVPASMFAGGGPVNLPINCSRQLHTAYREQQYVMGALA